MASRAFRALFPLVGAALLVACASSQPSAQADAAPADTAPVVCYASQNPAKPIIDPDNPVYSDADYTATQVKDIFAKAKAENSAPYRAYKAARDNAEVLACGRCACGCVRSLGHLNADDCFKDMHGFG
jgi:hypothetical protein